MHTSAPPAPAGTTAQRSALAEAQARVAGYLTTPVITAVTPWHPSQLTEQQQLGRARFEAAMQRDELRGVPSCFGGL